MYNVDHLVYAAPDLSVGIEHIERVLGVRATLGGRHPHGWGTRNALIALGSATYLEIVAPDPDQPGPDGPRVFGVDDLEKPRLVTWGAKGKDLERTVQKAKLHGLELGDVLKGSRQRPDGTILSWQMTDPFTPREAGIVPFLIDWGDTPSPALTSANGGSLIGFRAEHPDAARIQAALSRVGMNLPIEAGSAPALVATISTPNVTVELR